MNQVRIREVAIPIRSPIAVHTPNTCHSIKCFSLFIALNYKKTPIPFVLIIGSIASKSRFLT